MSNKSQPSVAVIGLGAQGLVTVKNLLEQDFRVTGFERNDYVGGIWHATPKHQVSALPSTSVNVSRERACFTDFAFPDGTFSYATAQQLDDYLNDYADHFELRPHCRLSTSVDSITRNDDDDTWTVNSTDRNTSTSSEMRFDKVVMATGPHVTAKIPNVQGSELFEGEITHAISFKDPQKFKGKRVIVVGAHNTAADTSTSMVGVAKEVYLSHRSASVVLARHLKNGTSLDHSLTWRKFQVKDMLDGIAPRLSQNFMDGLIAKIQKEEFGELDPQWRFRPFPSLMHSNPCVSDTLIPALRAGTIKSMHAIRKIVGADAVEMEDGTIVYADSIIFCTGYALDWSALGELDPSLDASAPSGHDISTPRLYQNIFSLDYPDSLAFVGVAVSNFAAFKLSDLSSMAIAQLWSNHPSSPSLPPRTEIQRWRTQHLAWAESVRALSPDRKFLHLSVRSRIWLPWVTRMAGCNLDDKLGWFTMPSWRLWWHDRELYDLLMDGIFSPHFYRVFDGDRPGARKKWDGARRAIVQVNADVKAGLEQRKRERAVATSEVTKA